MKFLISLFTLLLTINSCDSSKKVVENSKNMQDTLSGTYYITQLEDTDVSLYKLVISFDETSNKVTGFAGCNSLFGSYSLENNSITLENIATSKKMCQKDIIVIERQFLKALNAIDSFSINDTNISFSENDTILFKATSTIAVSKKSTASSDNDTYKTAVKYQTLTRGAFDFILISNQGISISKDQGLQHIEKHSIDATQWEELKGLIETVDLKSLQELKPPSKKHQYDGAPHATLAIQIGDMEYMTPTFDHGNPPKDIEALVNKVLSIKEKTVKQ
ncbi:META domain-containing protein [Winogradskyella psychrotolerans]|uniref:META domain-containing protein n=1 Tax=Winogradskyella psychrotolerans TaxID=1344585 RepID=UPI001C067029|nr:META domain-containing protein [Winogradskyella psychrotolerans]MBU2929459.1 META domain-containing protein [Winogradskyella psychrotolerans]